MILRMEEQLSLNVMHKAGTGRINQIHAMEQTVAWPRLIGILHQKLVLKQHSDLLLQVVKEQTCNQMEVMAQLFKAQSYLLHHHSRILLELRTLKLLIQVH